MTPYGAELVETVARGICRVLFADERVHGDARCCQLGGESGCCAKDLEQAARAALAATFAALQMPSEEMWIGIGRATTAENVWRAMLAQIQREIGE